jgi:hypothetical protein
VNRAGDGAAGRGNSTDAYQQAKYQQSDKAFHINHPF